LEDGEELGSVLEDLLDHTLIVPKELHDNRHEVQGDESLEKEMYMLQYVGIGTSSEFLYLSAVPDANTLTYFSTLQLKKQNIAYNKVRNYS
jgi:hypothetical protein